MTRRVSDHDLDDIDMEAVRYKPPGLDQLCCSTKFSRNELRVMYRGFKQVSDSSSLYLFLSP